MSERKIKITDIDLDGLEGEFYDRFVALLGRLATLNIADLASNVTGLVRTITAAAYTVLDNDAFLIVNNAGTVTITLPAASTFPERSIVVRTITANAVVSASSNVVPLAGGAAGTAILPATAGKWAWLVSDGVNWQTQMAA
jgi:hypothetical protein